MAIRINNPTIPTKENTTDRNKFIGLKFPLELGQNEGYFESTTITLEAAKENIKNLMKTRKGERVFQPNLGLGLEDVLFEQMNEEIETIVRDRIASSFEQWLPYVGIKRIDIKKLDDGNSNQFNIYVEFFINNLPTMFDSVNIVV
jgi:phage baseplate assembly protein W